MAVVTPPDTQMRSRLAWIFFYETDNISVLVCTKRRHKDVA